MMARVRDTLRSFGLARGTIAAFAVLLFLTAAYRDDLEFSGLLGQSFRRIGMNAVLVLAMLPAIRSGIGLNFGLPVGILAGLFGCAVALEADLSGFTGLAVALLVGAAIATPLGLLYGLLLNAVRGNEMMVGMYVGFAAVSYACIVWLLAPFTHPRLVWAIGGSGLRTTLQLRDTFGQVLDDFLSREILGVSIPTGLFLFVAFCCVAVWALFRTRLGLAVSAAGANPEFAAASGIRQSRTRIFGATASTVLGAIGIVVYAQSFGFVQLYMAPLYMALPAVAAILLGGATLERASLAHVVIGVTLFQSILTLTPDVTNAVIGGNMSETMRLGIQNGLILYALTRAGDRS